MWRVTCDRCHEVILDRSLSNTKDIPIFYILEARCNNSMGNNSIEVELCRKCYHAIVTDIQQGEKENQ